MLQPQVEERGPVPKWLQEEVLDSKSLNPRCGGDARPLILRSSSRVQGLASSLRADVRDP